MTRRSVVYRTKSGREPFAEYVENLRDRAGAIKVMARVDRAEQGNLGDHRSVGAGVVEMRIHFGPGYRVYVALDGVDLIILLCAGDKASQNEDIRKAKGYWREYRESL